jgi:hypothetical protein
MPEPELRDLVSEDRDEGTMVVDGDDVCVGRAREIQGLGAGFCATWSAAAWSRTTARGKPAFSPTTSKNESRP